MLVLINNGADRPDPLYSACSFCEEFANSGAIDSRLIAIICSGEYSTHVTKKPVALMVAIQWQMLLMQGHPFRDFQRSKLCCSMGPCP